MPYMSENGIWIPTSGSTAPPNGFSKYFNFTEVGGGTNKLTLTAISDGYIFYHPTGSGPSLTSSRGNVKTISSGYTSYYCYFEAGDVLNCNPGGYGYYQMFAIAGDDFMEQY